MNPTDPSAFDLVIGCVLFISFITFSLCMVSLKNCVDEEKLRREDSVSKVVAAGIPPERVLTDEGLMRAKIAKIAVGVFAVCAAYLVIRTNFT